MYSRCSSDLTLDLIQICQIRQIRQSFSLAVRGEDRPPTVIFDWDDTLCPTTWMRRVPTQQVAPGDERLAQDPFVNDA